MSVTNKGENQNCSELVQAALQGLRRAAVQLDQITSKSEGFQLAVVDIRLSLELLELLERKRSHSSER